MHNYATHVYMYSVHTLQNLKIKLIKKNGVEVGNGENRDINTIHYIYLILIQHYAKGRGLMSSTYENKEILQELSFITTQIST